jgi:hypothetical protein
MKTGLLFSGSALLGLCIVAAFPGCGSSSNGNNATDAGQTGDTSSNDSSGSSSGGSSSGDANDETSGDTGTSCTATVMPQGMQILAATNVTVQGVTSDGQAIYFDGSKLNAVALTGGTPKAIGAWDKSPQGVMFTSNKVALYWNGATQATNAHGALSVWTAGGGQQNLATQSNFGAPGGGSIDVSADGSLVLYTDNVTTANADIYVAGSDGSNKTKLVSAASIGTNCRPVLRFAGNTAVVGYCTSQPDGGSALTATVAAYSSAPNWQTVQKFATDAFYSFSIGSVPSGGGGAPTYYVEYVSNTGAVLPAPNNVAMYVEAIGGTAGTLIDAKGAGGIFTHAGTDVIYEEADGTVWRSPIANPAPAQIANGQYAGTLALSSDDKWVELFLNQDPTTFFTDMYLVSTTPADGGNTPLALSTCMKAGTMVTCSGANFGDAFTADNSRAIFFPKVIMSGSAGYVGAYDSLVLPPTGMPTTIANNVWEEFATSGAKTLYNDNYVSTAGFAGAADIESIDLASGTTTPTTLVSQADANFFLTADKKTIVYSWSACPGAKDGIYTLAAP